MLFIYICKPFSYTSIRAQTRENYKIYLITEGTVLFFLKVSNISFACLKLVGRIRRNQQHTCTCSEFYKQKAHFHRNWYSLPGRFLDVLNLFFLYITLTVTFLQVNFIFIIVLYIFPVCLLSFLVVYQLKSFTYIFISFSFPITILPE